MKHNFIIIFIFSFTVVAAQRGTAGNPDKLLGIKPKPFVQSQDSIATIGAKPFAHYIFEYFSNNLSKKLDTLNFIGICWTKFEIDEKGILTNIQCDPSTPPVLADFISTMLKETSGRWSFDETKSNYIKGSVIILPIQCSMTGEKESSLSVRILTRFLNDGAQERLYFLPTVEYTAPTHRYIGRPSLRTTAAKDL
jgi:hypothetical protein